jgi:hypothetical protein
MNKKIFTLLVGALLSFASSFSASAQTPTVHHKVENDVNFADTLRANEIETLQKDAFYLLSVTEIANPDAQISAAGLDSKEMVLFVDSLGHLRMDDLSTLDFKYGFTYGTSSSTKIAAILRASWCVDLYTTKEEGNVVGSNVYFDFRNKEEGLLLQAPYPNLTNGLWKAGAGGVYYEGRLDSAINLKDDLAVSGWHFSQSYLNHLQKKMPLYSKSNKDDSVLVFVLEKATPFQPAPGHGKGGWRPTVKHVAYNDLIKDANGNVRRSGDAGGTAVNNVLLFTLKKIDKFVLNQNDYNAISEKISFNLDTKNNAVGNLGWNPFTKAKGVEPHAQGYVQAAEVNDSLYRYGYMQFKKTGTTDDAATWLYVDTAFCNEGVDQFLSFNWSQRRDTIFPYGKWGALTLNNLATTSQYYKDNLAKNGLIQVDTAEYFDDIYTSAAKKPIGTKDILARRFWRLDSMIWAIADYIEEHKFVEGPPEKLGGDKTGFVWPPDGRLQVYNGVLKTGAPNLAIIIEKALGFDKYNDFSKVANYWDDVIREARKLGYPEFKDGGLPTSDQIGTGFVDRVERRLSVALNLDGHITKTTSPETSTLANNEKWGDASNGVIQDNFDMAYVYVDENNVKISPTNRWKRISGAAAYAGDLALWEENHTLRSFTDSIMENQSKFRVVYDPFVDSTFINVYQSRVRYPDFKAGSNNPVYHPFWKNSFIWDGTTATNPSKHSFNGKLLFSSYNGIDTVLISTADTSVFYGDNMPLSHIYDKGSDPIIGGGAAIRKDSLLYVDIQDLVSKTTRIATIAQTNGQKGLNTQIKLGFAGVCEAPTVVPPGEVRGPKITNDLYLIRNGRGEYLTVPLHSITDSVYWKTPRTWENPIKMPSYQWVVEKAEYVSPDKSRFVLTNREFKNVKFDYVVVDDKNGKIFIEGAHGNAAFIKDKDEAWVYGDSVPKKDAVQINADFLLVTNGFAKYSFLPLGNTVKGNQLLGYTYIDPDEAYMKVYALKYRHAMATGSDARYMAWNGYLEPKIDSFVYANDRECEPGGKLYLALEQMPKNIIQSSVDVTSSNAKYKSIYEEYGTKAGKYNNGTLLFEEFGYSNTDLGILPLARQAYRFLLKDNYKFSPTTKGNYLTVGGQDNYILSDRANAERPYIKGSGDAEGVFGIPYFYFRNTYFDIPGVRKVKGEGDIEVKDTYFALVQRLDTLSKDEETGWRHGYDDVSEYVEKRWGKEAKMIITKQIKESRELGAFIVTVKDIPTELKIAVRGDIALAPSTFTLEEDSDPLYRRFHWNDAKDFPVTKDDTPLVLEFNRLNDENSKLFENSGADQSSGGGYLFNVDASGALYTDSLGRTISYLGIKNINQFPYVTDPQLNPRGNTNYAFYVDTAYIGRGTGWIKPQYMLAVDTLSVEACPVCEAPGQKIKYRGYMIGRYLYNTSMYAKETRHPYGGSLNYDSAQMVVVEKIRPAGPGAVDGSAYVRQGNTKTERLAFAWAIHRGDSLIVLKNVPTAKPDGERFGAEDVKAWLLEKYPAGNSKDNVNFQGLNDGTIGFIEDAKYKPVVGTDKIGIHAIIGLGDNNENRHSDWVFSFRYVERDATDFIIESETAYAPNGSIGVEPRDRKNGPHIRPEYGGWMKFENGVPVISRTDSKNAAGESFVMNVQKSNYQAVSNDPVEGVTSGVKVIGGDGVVAILNASGKNVVITNALGQTLANVVLGSDNASVPVVSGIAFVSVDGEKAVKALVK